MPAKRTGAIPPCQPRFFSRRKKAGPATVSEAVLEAKCQNAGKRTAWRLDVEAPA